MNKKFVALSAMLLLGGGGSLFLTSCQKDYDGQIEILRNQIKSGVVDMNGLKAKLALLQEQITKLENALKQSDEAHKAEIGKLVQDLKAVKADLESQMARLQAQVDEAKTDINTLKGLVQSTEQTFNTKMLELSDRINVVDTSLNVLDGRVAQLEEQVKAILEKQGLVDKTIDNLKKEIEDLKNRPQTPDVADQVKKLEEALEQLKAVDTNLTQRLNGLDALIKQVKEAAEKKDAQLEALIQKAAKDIASVQAELDSQVQQLTSKMTGLSDAMGVLSSSVDALNQKYSVLDVKVTALQNDFKVQIDRIWDAINKNEAADAEEMALLKKSVAELQGALNNLNQEVKKGMAEVLERQKLFGQSLESMNQTLEKYKGDLNKIATQLDGLNVRVTALEQWAQDFTTAFGATLKGINDKIAALEKEVGSGSSADLTQIKDQLQELQDNFNKQSAELKDFKGTQADMAKKLTDFQTEMRNSLLAVQVNYTVVLQRLGAAEKDILKLANLTEELQTNVGKLNDDLFNLTQLVASHTTEIATLKAELAKLQDAQDAFVTPEQVTEMLEVYQQKIDATMENFLNQLAQKPNRDEMEKMIETASKALEGEIATMKTQIADLQNQVNTLAQKVTSLENWAKDFVTAYQTTMKVMGDRIASLEGKENTNADDIIYLKNQLQDMQTALQTQSDEMGALKNNQALLADSLTKFKEDMDAHLYSIQNNFALVMKKMGETDDKIQAVSDFAAVNRAELGKLNDNLIALTGKVGKQADEIVKLKSEIARLDAEKADFTTKEQVKEMLDKEMKVVNDTFKDVFTQLKDTATRDEVKQLINDASEKLENQITLLKAEVKDLQSKVDSLIQQVDHLKNWADTFEKAYDVTINEIKEKIKDLEGKHTADVQNLKNDLQKMQDALKDHTTRLESLEKDQVKYADELLNFRKEMTNKLLTLETNLNTELQKVGAEVTHLTEKFKDEVNRLDKNLGGLLDRVIDCEKSIVDLNKKLDDLKIQQGTYMTEERVNELLNDYQQKVDAELAKLENALAQKPTKEDMDALIDTTRKALQSQIDDMQTELNALKTEVKELQDKLADLLNRVQSMQLIPDFSNGAVTLTKGETTNSMLKLRVRVSPSTCVAELVKNLGFIRIESVPVIPVRGIDGAPTFTVSALTDLGSGIMEVQAVSQYKVPDENSDANLPFQVAVLLSDGNNERTTNYANVRFTPTLEKDQDVDYEFYFSDGTKINTLVDNFNVKDFMKAGYVYPMNILTDKVLVNGTTVHQLPEGTIPLVANHIQGAPASDPSKKYDVKYTLSIIFDKNNTPDGTMFNYIGVTPDGKIYMKASLNPEVTSTSLENYKLIIELQASDGKFVYGKKRTACVELKMNK